MNMHKTQLEALFFQYPMTLFGVRELGRKLHIDTKTIMKYLQTLIKEKTVLIRKEKGKYTKYEANRLSRVYKYKKSTKLIEKIIESGLTEHLEKTLSPKVIILFGSVQKGTYHKESDIDLFIQAKYKRIDLKKYEKKIGHKISLFFEEDIKKVSKGLVINICNGLVLSGKLRGFV